MLQLLAAVVAVLGQSGGGAGCENGSCLEEIRFKNDFQTPEAICAFVNLFGTGDETVRAEHITSSLRLNAEVVDTDHASCFELVATRLKVVTGELYVQGIASVTGSIHYTTDVKLTTPDPPPPSFLETGEALHSHTPPDVTHTGGWLQVASDNFDNGAAGWALRAHNASAPAAVRPRNAARGAGEMATSACNDGNRFLGGHCVAGAHVVSKVFPTLAEHSELHLTARFHFIDSWDGESAYAKVDGKYVWLDSHTSTSGGIDLCGGPHADSRLGMVVDVVVPHTAHNATVSFGALLDESSCEESWGVDAVHVQVR